MYFLKKPKNEVHQYYKGKNYNIKPEPQKPIQGDQVLATKLPNNRSRTPYKNFLTMFFFEKRKKSFSNLSCTQLLTFTLKVTKFNSLILLEPSSNWCFCQERKGMKKDSALFSSFVLDLACYYIKKNREVKEGTRDPLLWFSIATYSLAVFLTMKSDKLE